MLVRRDVMRMLAAGGAGLLLPSGVRLALAAAPTERRFVAVVMRGGLDGLAAVPPYADRDYRDIRGALALPPPGAENGILDLDGRFGLHPALGPFHALYRARELLVVHAVATPYRSRSHFDGQDLLENGTAAPHGAKDGWLNRTLALMDQGDRRLGLAVGTGVPLVLRGAVSVGTWAPQTLPEAHEDFLSRLEMLYHDDPVLGRALRDGMAAHRMAGEVLGDDPRQGGADGGQGRRPGRDATLAGAASAVGRLLADPRGPRIAVLEIGGWDTHAGQGTTTGRLAGRLEALSASVGALKSALGPAWDRTAVVMTTEFGRTAAPNGTGGTDHGTASVAFLAGGAIEGGRVLGRFPGLARDRLFEGRDLAPTTDLRGVLKGTLGPHFGLAAADLDNRIFPGSGEAPALRGLVRA